MNGVKKYKVIGALVAFILLLALIISVPSLAKLKNRNTIHSVASWDGTVATSYKSGNGTIDSPYIISNGNEFAFFIEQLKTNDYQGKYFELSNDIIINSGVFSYSESEGLRYTVDNRIYYVKEYTNEYYDNVNREGYAVGYINSIAPIENFKGNLNGKSFTIFGLRMANSVEGDWALFKNLNGAVSDLYITNSVVSGNGNVAGVAINSNAATLTNVVYDGYVLNKKTLKTTEINIDPMAVTGNVLENTTMLTLPSVDVDGGVESIKLIGEYHVLNQEELTSIKINGIEVANNTFDIDLTMNTLTEIPISAITTVDGVSINLSNLKLKVEYYNDVTSGIIANSTNSSLINVINKADIYGTYISSGIVGKANESLQISQSYNTGNVSSQYISSGIVGIVKNNANHTTLTNVYNAGYVSSNVSGAIIGVAQDNTGLININNSFNTSSNYAVNLVSNSTINIVDSYSVNGLSAYNGIVNGEFTLTNIEHFYSEEAMKVIKYNKFVSFEDVKTNTTNAWIYEKNSLPILYIDDLNSPIANINISKYSWNNLGSELNLIDISTNITFAINDVSAINPVKEKYYYITNSRVPMTEEELNAINTWQPYESVVTISESGYYVVYAKIVDMDDDVTYMNTDILVLNVSGFQTTISSGDMTWSSFKTNLSDVYVNKDINLTLLAHDDLIPITSVEYYISSKELTQDEVYNITTWNVYTEPIVINETGKYVLYAKITNSESNVKYLNTDYILYGGYKENITLGNKNINYDTNYITNKSSINMLFESDFEILYKEGYTHNLISNILLPEGTKITLIDKINNKVYKKVINSEEDLYGYNDSCIGVSSCSKYATYSFSMFEEVGTENKVYYDESANYGKLITNEKYSITIDFKDTNLVDNYYNMSFYMALKSSNGDYLYQTLNNYISDINVYSTIDDLEIETSHSLISDYANQTIYYNSNSETIVNLTNVVTYQNINNKNVIDTNYESKKSGILIKLYNSDGAQINGSYLDGMIFELNGEEFYSSNDNSIKINLGSVTDRDSKMLKIKTRENSSALENGTYYIKINQYISDDGYYYDSLYENSIQIPLVVENQTYETPEYSFNVDMLTESIVLDKKEETHQVGFNIIYSGSFIEPNIRVSLYKKNEFTAYNQDYTLINLSEYVSNELVSAEVNKYYVDIYNSNLTYELLPNVFDNNGYKYVFELYDGTRRISKIEKYFIVK